MYIKRGIEKYGNLWTVMLKDPELRFSLGRTTDALIKRATSKAFREKVGHSWESRHAEEDHSCIELGLIQYSELSISTFDNLFIHFTSPDT